MAIAELTFDENENMQDVLMEAVREGAVDVVKFLISKGVWCGKLAFNTAVSNNSVTIAKLLSGTESALDEVLQGKNQHWKKSNIQFEFRPKDEYVFKRLFVLVGVAHRYLYLKNTEKPIVSIWHLRNFNMNSNLKACIFSSTHYRKSLNKGLYKVRLEIPWCEKYEDYTLDDVNQNLDSIMQDVFNARKKSIEKIIDQCFADSDYKSNREGVDKSDIENRELESEKNMEGADENLESRSAEDDDPDVQNKIADAYYNDGDYSKAKECYEKSAFQNNSDAQCRLGEMYENGHGVTQDNDKAVFWYEKAVEHENADARVKLGNLYCKLGKKSFDEQNYVRACEFYEKSASFENGNSEYNLGEMYENGEGSPHDNDKAIFWYERAVEHGSVDARIKLGGLYCKLGEDCENGQRAPQNNDKAIFWYEKAVEHGNAEARIKLAGLYYGRGKKSYDEQDYVNARKLYEKAASHGNSRAEFRLGDMYDTGKGVEKNPHRAFKWYEKAAKYGIKQAQYKLGVMYECGQGVQQKKDMAIFWYKKAAGQGDELARKKLEKYGVK